jgi:hypothetical protein
MARNTDFREALRVQIEQITGVTIRPGKFRGPYRAGNRGCIWSISESERPNVEQERLAVRCRIFLSYDQPVDEQEEPLSGAPLEDIVEKLKIQLSAGDQSLGGIVWYYRLTEAEYNMEQYGVEMHFEGVAANTWSVIEPFS